VAIAFALEGDPRDYRTDAGILAFHVNAAPAAWLASRLRRGFPLPSRVGAALSSERHRQ